MEIQKVYAINGSGHILQSPHRRQSVNTSFMQLMFICYSEKHITSTWNLEQVVLNMFFRENG